MNTSVSRTINKVVAYKVSHIYRFSKLFPSHVTKQHYLLLVIKTICIAIIYIQKILLASQTCGSIVFISVVFFCMKLCSNHRCIGCKNIHIFGMCAVCFYCSSKRQSKSLLGSDLHLGSLQAQEIWSLKLEKIARPPHSSPIPSFQQVKSASA